MITYLRLLLRQKRILYKKPLFILQERVELIRDVVRPYQNVDVQSIQGLTVHFVRQLGSQIMLRGVRTLSDMDQEFTMALANQAMAPEVETVFLMAREEYSHISSSLIKQIGLLGGEAELRKFVPEPVTRALLKKLHRSG